MHAITFATKRAHLKGVAFGRGIVKKVADMTPARFDFLYAIRSADYWFTKTARGVEARMSEVREMLGLHPSTISKLASRLVELGWIRTFGDPVDARRVVLRLTLMGLRLMRRATKIVFRERRHIRFFEAFFCGWHPNEEKRAELWEHWATTNQIAEVFGDRSTLLYRYDNVPEEFREPGPEGLKRAIAVEDARIARIKEAWAEEEQRARDGDSCMT